MPENCAIWWALDAGEYLWQCLQFLATPISCSALLLCTSFSASFDSSLILNDDLDVRGNPVVARGEGTSMDVKVVTPAPKELNADKFLQHWGLLQQSVPHSVFLSPGIPIIMLSFEYLGLVGCQLLHQGLLGFHGHLSPLFKR